MKIRGKILLFVPSELGDISLLIFALLCVLILRQMEMNNE